MKVSIDPFAGFCFGVQRAIEIAENELQHNEKLFCIGEIVHNEGENERLENSGLQTIDHKELVKFTDNKVLFRAHGEPPSTYKLADKHHVEIIDATCPVVLKVQKKIESAWKEMKKVNGQVVIFGKKNHPEVLGFVGQTDNNGIVVENEGDLYQVDFKKPIRLFVQTTKNKEDYVKIINIIEQKLKVTHSERHDFKYFNNICGQVSQRIPKLEEFCKNNEVVIFVSGKNSSNGRQLYNICQEVNPNSYFVTSAQEIISDWFFNVQTVGITGATSTPSWQMKTIADHISKI
jgi:4-hydroxy-3-methylbut-2-en-1-yl diphosphate reductase